MGRAFEAWARAALDELQPLIEFQFGHNRAVRADSVWSAFLKALDPRVNGSVLDKSWASLDGKSKRAVKRVAGVAVADVLPEGDQLRQEWLQESTDLIRGTERFREKVRAIIKDPLNAGLRPERIAKMLEKQLGIGKRRAELIARDQTLKAYGRLQRARQERAGIKRYRWVTSRDERVRHRHRDLDNTIQRWDQPPIVHPSGRRAHPGGDYQCRCSAAPVVDEEVNAPRPTPGLVEPDLELSQFVSVSLPAAPRGPRPARRGRAAPATAPAAPVSLQGLELKDLGVITDPASFRAASLKGLRSSPEFLRTGRVPKEFDRRAHEVGVVLRLDPDSDLGFYLKDGRHRFTVAKEAGLQKIWATVQDANGKQVYRGFIDLQGQRPKLTAPASAPKRAPRATPAANFEAAGFAVDDAENLNEGVRAVFGRKRPNQKDLRNILGNLPIQGRAGVVVGRGDLRVIAQIEGGGRIARRFARDEANKLVAEHLEFYLEGLRGKGVGRAALNAQIRAYKRLGVDRIELHAQAEGRAIWPKLGFRLRYPESLESAKAAFQASTGADVSAIKSIQDLARAPGGSDWLQTANGPWNYLELKL